MTVITRFAPSPTGMLHIGGARTALFNWLYARRHGGQMLLRVEDTDRERSTKAAYDAIIDGLTWLGLEGDGEPISQASRADRHREVALQLVEAGEAYYCYASPEELAQMREEAREKGLPPRYDGRWRDRNPSEAPNGVAGAIRIKAPADGETLVDDKVQGSVRFPNKDIDDFVILRSDGSPTDMLAVVVDDHDMGVTHIIRGDDHLTNAGRQSIIYHAMGWETPVMAHIPLIHGSDGAKLSKRHGALGIDAYRDMGYLPEALRNYLVRLGWAHGDDEIMSTDQMIEWFDFDGMSKGAARFDFDKLLALNGHYIRQADDPYLLSRMVDILPSVDDGIAKAQRVDESLRQQILAAMPAMKERAKTVLDLIANAGFLFKERPIHLDERAQGVLDESARKLLAELSLVLASQSEWTSASLEQIVRDFAEQNDLKLGKIAQPIRAALTGGAVSPPVFDMLEILGKSEALARIGDQAAT